jgi:uncharacterized protein (TIGR00299 family) protein
LRHLHLNPIGGLAGDMFCAALLDLQPELFDDLQRLVQNLDPPPGLELALNDAPGGLHGLCFDVQLPAHDHRHTHYSEIRELLDAAELPRGVRARAQAIFRELAEAEARVHGVEPDRVTFHEVGNWDSIVDIVSAAFLLENLQVSGCSCGPLPRGSGRVHTRHGWLPVPAPATAHLLQGMNLVDDGIEGERVTPTGAAILRSLHPQSAGGGRLLGTGYGFGNRRLDGVPNCLQVQLFDDEASAGFRTDRVLEIHFELDDQNPEDLASGVERIRQHPGVLSLLLLNAIGKRGRPTQQVQILAQPEIHDALVEACFRETRTLGLRYRETRRWTLERRELSIDLPEGRIRVKLNLGPDGWRAKAENRDLSNFPTTQQRERIARLAEAAALQQNQTYEPDD